jgi:2-oxoglutarate dehydrogenase complex dehydrogenase (E1) component-like enzyme
MAGVDILASAMNGANAAYLADTYARWVEDPAGVDPSFAELFAALNDDAKAVLTDAMGASWAPGPGVASPLRRKRSRPRRVPSRPPLLSLPTPTPSARRHWIPCAR